MGTELKLWPKPKSRDVALFTDLRLYTEALDLALKYGNVSASILNQELGRRLQKARLVRRQGKRTLKRLLRELRRFEWLEPMLDKTTYALTDEGHYVLDLFKQDPRAFRRLLIVKMQQFYVIPGWFIERLWGINPKGQGEVIIPSPLPGWHPDSRQWKDNEWTSDLYEQTLEAATCAKKASLDAFPIREIDWIEEVKKAWNRLSNLKPRGSRKQERANYSPRRRLNWAMREAAVSLLFDRIPYNCDAPDFPGERSPIYPRTYMNWCPRLESLELLFYTDWHPAVSGRLLFPVAVFRSSAPEGFELVGQGDIKNPQGNSLWLHQPKWEAIRTVFLETMIEVHQRFAVRRGTIYVSLLDVRDEMCRLLRISSRSFDCLLKQALLELPARDFPWSLGVETDIREEQRGGAKQYRQPVYIDKVPHTLIGLARLPR